MKARRLIESSDYEPETLKVIYKAFDAAWVEVSGRWCSLWAIASTDYGRVRPLPRSGVTAVPPIAQGSAPREGRVIDGAGSDRGERTLAHARVPRGDVGRATLGRHSGAPAF